MGDVESAIYVWDLTGPPAAEPLTLKDFGQTTIGGAEVVFEPTGRWLLGRHDTRLVLWPVVGRRAQRLVHEGEGRVFSVAFSPDGTELFTGTQYRVRRWLLTPVSGEPGSVLIKIKENIGAFRLAAHPGGRHLLAAKMAGDVLLIPLDGGDASKLEGFGGGVDNVVLSADGRLAAAGGVNDENEKVIRIWDLESGTTRDLGAGDGVRVGGFTPDGRLVSVHGGNLYVWDLEEGSPRQEGRASGTWAIDVSPDGRHAATAGGGLVVHDLENGTDREIVSHGPDVEYVKFDRSGEMLITGDSNGVVRVGPVTGEEPHLLLGHEEKIWDLAVSPDGRTIASAGQDGTVRLWPMPEGRPLHTLAYEEFLDWLHQQTNLRVVPDEDDPGDYRFDAEPFAGWETTPPW